MEESEVYNVLEMISKVTELNDIAEFMQDSDLDDALEIMIKLIAKPSMPAQKAAELVVYLQAISMQCKLKGKFYMVMIKSPEATKKKNFYLTMAESLEKLSDSLKYLVKFTN